MDGQNAKLVCVRGKGDRDPRYHVISICYLVEVDSSVQPVGQDDAETAGWYDIAEVLKTPEKFAFDHHSIVMELCTKFSQIYGKYLPK